MSEQKIKEMVNEFCIRNKFTKATADILVKKFNKLLTEACKNAFDEGVASESLKRDLLQSITTGNGIGLTLENVSNIVDGQPIILNRVVEDLTPIKIKAIEDFVKWYDSVMRYTINEGALEQYKIKLLEKEKENIK